jgi:hypothetical protein
MDIMYPPQPIALSLKELSPNASLYNLLIVSSPMLYYLGVFQH